MTEQTPASPPPYGRLPSLKSFLPLSEDTIMSTRGQHLPSLLQQSLSNRGNSQRPASVRSEDLHSDTPSFGARGSIPATPRFDDDRRSSIGGASVLLTPQMRSQRLIGNSNPRYRWEQYWKSDEELKKYSKPVRKYYERNNYLIQQYAFIDRLLDSSLPHNLIQEYTNVNIPETISEESGTAPHSPFLNGQESSQDSTNSSSIDAFGKPKIKRTPKNLYKVPDEETSPLLGAQHNGYGGISDDVEANNSTMPLYEPEEETDSQHRIVTIAIYVNLVANTVLLAMKIVVTILTSSLSVLASLVDAALDFLSTAIVWVTTRLISRQDRYQYPIGRAKLEPVGVLIFSVIMITAFFQVLLEGAQRFMGNDRTIVQLTTSALVIMVATVVIKGLCWFWCRMIKNSSVQALAQDAMTDVVFNTFSIIFPLVGYYAKLWWMDPLGGVLLSLWVIINWSETSSSHIKNLTGAAATADERNVLLYLSMRFAKTIKQIQGLQAYHSGDKLIVEADIVVDENINIRDAHDLGESLQYVLESVPSVDRAFVHLDYASWNLPTHMSQSD
ncbi:putative cation diffusion facilitator 10 protein [Neofusicoccum parvum UCRNP2]|uniref:Putative cation diffusion facilitator 10 protein n=1 Tax=Botryosphaeria parva (strain UCR-NP2) TaxID=1287680 RepID=R1EHJ2_BOTPV|nr:putative cation diffusion facilitator 10 protein [Neofusicoccum parvum UCRNP2]